MISGTFVGALRKPLVTGKSPFEGLSSAPGALKSAFSRHNSLVLNVLADQAACEIEERAGWSAGAERLWTSLRGNGRAATCMRNRH